MMTQTSNISFFDNNAARSRVAVLLAANNGVDWIADQIYSILNQRHVDLTLWISVDRHNDGTLELLNNLSLSDVRIRLLPIGPNFGGAAKNFFRLLADVNFSDFDYVAFADQDDIWFDNKIISSIEYLNKTNSDAYSCNTIAFWPNGRYKLIDKSQPQRRLDFLFESAGPGCTFVFTKELAIDFQFFLISSALARNFVLHDWLLYAFARSKGYHWEIDSKAYMLYRQHENNCVGANVGLKAFFFRVKILMFGRGLHHVADLLNILNEFSDSNHSGPLTRKSLLYFIKNVNHIRRKPIDRLFAVFLLLFAFIRIPK
jgi:rhamnosyltransferase